MKKKRVTKTAAAVVVVVYLFGFSVDFARGIG